MIAPGVPKLPNYHPMYFEDLAKWSQMFSSIVRHARLHMKCLDDTFPKKLSRYIKDNFFPKANFRWPGFSRGTVVKEIAKTEGQLVYPDDLIIRGAIKRTQRIPSNICAFGIGAIVEIDTQVGELIDGDQSVVGIMYFHESMPGLSPTSSVTRYEEFQLEPQRGSKYSELFHTALEIPGNYHPEFLNPTQSSSYYKSMFILLGPILNRYLYEPSIPQLEPFFPGHAIATMRCPDFDTTLNVLSIDTPRFGAFRRGDDLITLGVGNWAHTIEARYDGVLMTWEVGRGYRVAGKDTLGELLYFHPDKPHYHSYVDNEWFYSGSGDGIEVQPDISHLFLDIDLSDKIFDPEEPKATKPNKKEKNDGRRKKRQKAAARKALQKIKNATLLKRKPTFSSEVSDDDDDDAHEQQPTGPLSDIVHKDNEGHAMTVDSRVSHPVNSLAPSIQPKPPIEKASPRPTKPVTPKTPTQPSMPKPIYPTVKVAEGSHHVRGGHSSQTKPVRLAAPKSFERRARFFERRECLRWRKTWIIKPNASRPASQSTPEKPNSPHEYILNDITKQPRPFRTAAIQTSKTPSPTPSTDSPSPRSGAPTTSASPTGSSLTPPNSPCRSDSRETSTSSLSSPSSDDVPPPPLTIPQPIRQLDKSFLPQVCLPSPMSHQRHPKPWKHTVSKNRLLFPKPQQSNQNFSTERMKTKTPQSSFHLTEFIAKLRTKAVLESLWTWHQSIHNYWHSFQATLGIATISFLVHWQVNRFRAKYCPSTTTHPSNSFYYPSFMARQTVSRF